MARRTHRATTTSLGLLVLVAVLSSSCKKAPPKTDGHWYRCTCPYLTDFDDVAKHSLDVCVFPGSDPAKAAYDCATHLTHGPTEACSCGPARGPCDGSRICKSNEYK